MTPEPSFLLPPAVAAAILLQRAAVGVVVNAGFAAAGWRAGTLSGSGAAGAFLVGTCVWTGLGWRGYLVLLSFFVLSALLTRLGWRRKLAAGLAEAEGGRRTARQAFANGGVGAAAALAAGLAAALAGSAVPAASAGALAVSFTAAFAAAAADTAGTEVGQLHGRRTRLITTLEPVPRGTDGGISAEGTAAAAGAALLVSSVAVLLGLQQWPVGLLTAGAGFLGALTDSLLGATLERRGLLDNDRVNLLATATGAVLALLGALLLG